MKQQNGFSILEALISLLLISVILLSLDAISLVALRENRNAYLQNIAEIQLNSLIEKIHVSSVSEIIDEIQIWNKQNKEQLPNGKGVITGEFPHYLITLFWGESTNKDNCNDIKIGDKLKCLKIQL